MSSNMKTYSVSKVKQLIDLNGESINFEIMFRVTSRNGAPFDILVVDQATLDGNTELKYKSVTNGTISGRIKHDKNIYQNHFLILRSENPCECDVEIQKTDLPKNIPPPPPSPSPQHVQSSLSKNITTDKQDSFHWIKIILIIGLFIGLGFSLYWFSQKKEDKPQLYTPPKSLHSSPSNISVSENVGKNHLLERLKGLNMS